MILFVIVTAYKVEFVLSQNPERMYDLIRVPYYAALKVNTNRYSFVIYLFIYFFVYFTHHLFVFMSLWENTYLISTDLWFLFN